MQGDINNEDQKKNPVQLTISTLIDIPYDIDKLDYKLPVNGINHNNEQNKVESQNGTFGSLNSMVSVKTSNTDCDNSSNEEPKSNYKPEKWWAITLQVSIPFIIAGFGTIGAGVVLGKVEQYRVFQEVENLYILVPAILGLKGNLDMCLASRLSTQANLGNMARKREFLKMIVGNIAIVQVQAIVAALIVSAFAMSVGGIMNGGFIFKNCILLASSSVLTATVSCFILDFVMIGVIFGSYKTKMNPDNLATPLAASIGDVVSLSLLSEIASHFYAIIDDYFWVLIVILCFYVGILLPIWILIVRKNKYTRPVLTKGWVPVISAIVISGLGGLVLDKAVTEYKGFVVFQPIINGIGGNLVSVQSSRISTMLHQTSILGILPPHTSQWVAPWTALFTGVFSAKTARILILMAIPGQTAFVFIADYLYMQKITVTVIFVATYVSVGLIQVMILLYVAHILIHFMWRKKIDPDNSAIPYLTALGDLSGSSLLLLAFVFLRHIGQEYQPL